MTVVPLFWNDFQEHVRLIHEVFIPILNFGKIMCNLQLKK